MDDKIRVTPVACVSHDDQSGGIRIEMEMPGADKKDISLEMRKDSFCVSAPRGQYTEYSGCFALSHEVLPEKAEPNMKMAFSRSSRRLETGNIEQKSRSNNKRPFFTIRPFLFCKKGPFLCPLSTFTPLLFYQNHAAEEQAKNQG